MKVKEIRDLGKEEIKRLIEDKKTRALQVRFDLTTRQVKNNREYRQAKKDIARSLTVLKEK